MVARFALLAACLLAAADALVVGGRGLSSVRQAATPLAPFTIMKSQEDKEFEEWARKKKIAAGVDPDEDFAAGREAESKIYVVGGAPAPPRHPPAHPPPGATHSQPPRARFAALCAECGVRCSLRCSELCVRCFRCLFGRTHHGARSHDRRHLGLQRGLPHAPVRAQPPRWWRWWRWWQCRGRGARA